MFGRKPDQLEETRHGLAIATALTGSSAAANAASASSRDPKPATCCCLRPPAWPGPKSIRYAHVPPTVRGARTRPFIPPWYEAAVSNQ
jgi:hypothetical protein